MSANMEPFGLFLISLITFWWAYLTIFIIGVVILCLTKEKSLKIFGSILTLLPICCYILGYLAFSFFVLSI